jgi:hypothetical protein
MRTFSCFTSDSQSSVPTQSFIYAEDLERARLLVCRELLAAPNAISIEIYEAGALLHTEWAPSAARSFEG